MKPVKLQQIIPQSAPVNLWVDGALQSFTLRPKNLEDDAWVAEHWGGPEDIEKVFTENKHEKIARFLFRIIEPKDPLAGKRVEQWDEDGIEKVTVVRPAWRVLLAGVRGQPHMDEVVRALMKTWGMSLPLPEDDDGKKKPTRKKKQKQN